MQKALSMRNQDLIQCAGTLPNSLWFQQLCTSVTKGRMLMYEENTETRDNFQPNTLDARGEW